MKLSELRENPNNPSKCSEKDLERLAGKLKRVPLGLTAMRIAYVTDDPEGGKMVISGNKRLRVLKRAYGEDAELPDEYFQDVTPMSEAERHEFIVTANVSDGEWDLDKLMEQYELDELKELMDTNTLTDLEESLKYKQQNEEFERNPDAVPEVEGEYKSQMGKTYALGRHRLLCWDSTKEDCVEKLLGDKQADLVMTDPPYNVDYHGGSRNDPNYGSNTIMNDKMSDNDFLDFMTKVYKSIAGALKPGGAFYVWGTSNRPIGELELGLRKVPELYGSTTLIWVKNALIFNMRKDYCPRSEICRYGWKLGAGHYFCEDATLNELIRDDTPDIDNLKKEEAIALLHQIYDNDLQSDVQRWDKPAASKLHPTMKPVGLIKRLILNSSRTKELVVDFFLGSGTTIMACEECDRTCYGVEMDPKYCDVIRKRWAEYTHGEGCDWESLTPEVNDEQPDTDIGTT